MRTVSAKVPDHIYEALVAVAKKRGLSLNALLKEIIVDYLKRVEGLSEVDIAVDQNQRDELEKIREKVEILEEIVKILAGVRYHQILQQVMKKRSMSTTGSNQGRP